MSLRNLPDEVTILRASGTDAYGNPGASWESPSTSTVRGFQVRRDQLLLPPDADVQLGDRVRVNGVTYAVEGEPNLVRSMRAAVLVTVGLARLEVTSG
ncbi:hypothetical protein [Actinopolymorpha pittospori]|uniref:Head-to-tail stopper n=1 Tax=Actinopolymorpha pittospori TaxID=648752 RepID=A0A927MVX7_9ACTN|nr:hypothetical protein [Actinopolymorpha pittospori]MBE1606248.1 hypothetical protein [Actinopolymorpha pittospori]